MAKKKSQKNKIIIVLSIVGVVALTLSMFGFFIVRRQVVSRNQILRSDVMSVPSVFNEMAESALSDENFAVERDVIRTGNLDLLVDGAEEVASEIGKVASRYGGYIQSSYIYEIDEGIKSGSVTIRVPEASFRSVWNQIKDLAVKVESEREDVSDVTDIMVDLEARLKNKRAEEEAYLEIMERAEEVKDVLMVADRLSRVRGEIERLDGQLERLSDQVEMSTITISLTAEREVNVFGIHWRPLFILKREVRALLEGITQYLEWLVGFVIRLPVITLWAGTIGGLALLVWKGARLVWDKIKKK